MASPNIGDRVKWAYEEKGFDEAALHGKVTGMDVRYIVRWDDGTEEVVDGDDIELEPSNP